MPQQRKSTAVAIAAALTVAYAYFYQGGGWNQNTRFALVRSIVEHHTLQVDETIAYKGRPVSGDLARHDGHVYSDKAPGASFTAVPAVVATGAFFDDPTTPESLTTLAWVATIASAALPTVACALLLFHVSIVLGLGEGAAAFAALAFGLATPAWAYATLMFGHALAAACLMAGFAAAIALKRENGTARDNATKDALLGLAVGLAGGWATVTEYPCAVPAAIVALLALLKVEGRGQQRRLRVAAGIAVGALGCAAVLAMHNTAAFGSPFALGYSHEAGDFGGMKQGFMGITWPKADVLGKILFGAYRGLFYHSPVLAPAVAGLAMLVAAPKTRRVAIAASLVLAFHLLLNAAYFYWFGGSCFGPRHVVPALPFLALGLAALWSRGGRALRGALLALTAASAFITFVAVATTVQQPEWFQSPWLQYNWPSFAQGRLGLNQMSILDNDAARVRNPVTHSWNLGEKMGLHGLASLIPLLAMEVAVLGAWWAATTVAMQGAGDVSVASMGNAAAPGAASPRSPASSPQGQGPARASSDALATASGTTHEKSPRPPRRKKGRR